MKTFVILGFVLLASACILAVKAEESNENIAALQNDDQPEVTVNADEKAPVESDEATEEDEESNNDEESEEESDEESEDESDEQEAEDKEENEVQEDEEDQSKRSLGRCRYYKNKIGYWCHVCCRRVCRIKYCARKICTPRYPCKRRVCRYVRKFKLVKRPIRIRVYGKWVIKYVLRRQYYTVKVCSYVRTYCPGRCRVVKKRCGVTCRPVCSRPRCNRYIKHLKG